MKFFLEKYNFGIEIATRYGIFIIGLGWWKGSPKLFHCEEIYYDGNNFSFRIGPLFFQRMYY